MKGIFLALSIGIATVGGGLFLRHKGFSLPNLHLPGQVQVPRVAMSEGGSSPSSQVLGAHTINTNQLGTQLSGIGNIIGRVAGSLGVQTVDAGTTLVNNVTSTPTSQADVIDMASVVKDISTRVESIPGSLANQAKIEYCRQVLQAATASATKQ